MYMDERIPGTARGRGEGRKLWVCKWWLMAGAELILRLL